MGTGRSGYRPGHSKWTTEKEDWLRENYAIHGATKCAAILSMTPSAVVSQAFRLGIKSKYADRYKNKTPYRRKTGCGDISGNWFGTLRAAARIRKIDFNITVEDAWDLFLKQDRKCSVSGVVLHFPVDGTHEAKRQATASLDRIDSSLGYTVDNCEWIHKKFQQMKMTDSKEQFIQNCREVANYNKKRKNNALHVHTK